MGTIDRRNFIHTSSLLAGIPVLGKFINLDLPEDSIVDSGITFGLICNADHPETDLKAVNELGFSTCQLNIKDYSPDLAKRLKESLLKYKLKPITLICMGPGSYIWNLKDGPSTIGLVPRENRQARVERLKAGIDFCKAATVPAIHAHFGFIPEDPKDVLYAEFVEVMKDLGKYALAKSIDIYFETGQETPITLRRAIEDIGTGNLFVNYDTANLVMYGKSNPLDGIKILGSYIKSFHAKDGLYPANPTDLGKEVLIPHGEVNFPAIVQALKKLNFKGNITIECELVSSNTDYILKTKSYLEHLINID